MFPDETNPENDDLSKTIEDRSNPKSHMYNVIHVYV